MIKQVRITGMIEVVAVVVMALDGVVAGAVVGAAARETTECQPCLDPIYEETPPQPCCPR